MDTFFATLGSTSKLMVAAALIVIANIRYWQVKCINWCVPIILKTFYNWYKLFFTRMQCMCYQALSLQIPLQIHQKILCFCWQILCPRGWIIFVNLLNYFDTRMFLMRWMARCTWGFCGGCLSIRFLHWYITGLFAFEYPLNSIGCSLCNLLSLSP